MFTLRNTSIAALALTLVLTATGCSGSDVSASSDGAGGDVETVKVAAIDVEGTIPVLLGKDRGIFKKHGISIESTMSPAFDGTLAAVMNGKADIGFGASPPMLRSMVKGAPISTVAQTATIRADETQAAVISTDPALKDPLDLMGKKIAVSSLNDLASIGIRTAVGKAGGDPDKVQFVELPGPQRLPALTNGKVDAAIFLGASAVAALKTKGVHLMFQYTEALPNGSPLDAYFSRKDYIGKNQEVLKRFRGALNEAAEYSNTHPEEVRKYVRELLTDVPEQVAVVDDMDMPTYDPGIDPDALMELQDDLVRYGGLEKTIPADEYFSFKEGE